MKTNRGTLYIVSAPSGAGKTTVCTSVLGQAPGIRESVSYTTRPPRNGEVHDRHYTFITKEEFQAMAGRDEFIEWAEVYGNYYGTSKKRIEEILQSGDDAILDIDIKGALQIRGKGLPAILIFIVPPSLEELYKRLTGRGTDPQEAIRQRFEKSREEIANYAHYDYLIVNDSLDMAVRQLESIILSDRLKTKRIDRDWMKRVFHINSGQVTTIPIEEEYGNG